MKQLLYYFIALIAICSCDLLPDPDYPKEGYLNYMPEETQIGANTFGCYINGKLVAVQGKYKQEGTAPSILWFGSIVKGFYSKEISGDTTMLINIQISPYEHILLQVTNLRLDTNSVFECHYCSDKIEGKVPPYVAANVHITKFNKDEQVISARFDTIVIPALDNYPYMELTNGQFDIKYGKNFYP